MHQPTTVSPIDDSPTIEDLPNEMVVMFLKELPLVDLVNSRLVSKRFRLLVDCHFKFQELVAFDNSSYDDLSHFHRTVEPFKCENFFQPLRSNFLDSSTFELLFADLRCLVIDCELANLESLNKFENLQRLDLYRPIVIDRQTLKLHNLRHLTILNLQRNTPQVGAQLLIDSKSLEKIYCENLEAVRFGQPETVRHLLIEEYSPELLQFRNLRVLKIAGTYSLCELKSNILYTLPELNEIHLKCYGLLLDLEPLRLLVDEVVRRAAIRDRHLKVFVFGLQIVRPFDEYEYEVLTPHEILQNQLHNYEALGDHLEYYTKMHYGDLLEFYPDRLPADLTDKFSNLRIVSAGLISDAQQFLTFLNACRHVIDLELNVTGLEQWFFDRLNLNPYTLNYLILNGENELNYEFCLKLPYLWNVVIHQNLELEMLFALLKRLRYLRYFSFKHRGELLNIGRTSRNLYFVDLVLLAKRLEHKNLSFKQLIEKLTVLCKWIENGSKMDRK